MYQWLSVRVQKRIRICGEGCPVPIPHASLCNGMYLFWQHDSGGVMRNSLQTTKLFLVAILDRYARSGAHGRHFWTLLGDEVAAQRLEASCECLVAWVLTTGSGSLMMLPNEYVQTSGNILANKLNPLCPETVFWRKQTCNSWCARLACLLLFYVLWFVLG